MRVSFQGERRKASRTDLWGGRRVTGAFTRKPPQKPARLISNVGLIERIN